MTDFPNPFEAISARAWLMIALVIIALGPASYVWRYFYEEHSARDITQPPPDLSWKTHKLLLRNLAIIVGLAGLSVFIFTPQAEAFAKSEWFAPTLMGSLASLAFGSVGAGWRNGEVTPWLRGITQSFGRETQPKRYWASMIWNGTVGIALALGSAGLLRDAFIPRCNDPETTDKAKLEKALSECTVLLTERDLDRIERAETFAGRGRIYQRLGDSRQAVRDYTAALSIDPTGSDTFYNRGTMRLAEGNPSTALLDFDSALAQDPDNNDAYLGKARAHFALKQYQLADRDLARVDQDNPEIAAILAQRAEFAIERNDFDAAIGFASQALRLESGNTFALRLRSEAYWKRGDKALSQADDDRVRAIEGFGPD